MSFNILIVDDSSSMRAVIKRVVAISGFKMDQCYEAANGREALDVLAKNWVDAIITDINMPEMNGLELLDRLHGDELLREIPVIVVSTERSQERLDAVMVKGAKSFINKPFLPEEIRRQLYEILGVGHEGGYSENQEQSDECDF